MRPNPFLDPAPRPKRKLTDAQIKAIKLMNALTGSRRATRNL